MPFADIALTVAVEAGAAEAMGAAALADFAAGAVDVAVTSGMVEAAGEGLAVGTEVGTLATTDTALTGGASGVVPSAGTTEIAGGGPTAATGEAAPTQTEKLAQQILQPAETPAAPPTGTPPDELNPNPQTAPTSAEQGAKPGIIDRATQWAEAHPTAAAIVGTQLAGAVGGVGKAALEKEIAQRNIRARSELLSQQTQEQLKLSRTGTMAGGVNVAPSGQTVLRRPDGTLVYAKPGIIAGQTGG